MEVAGLAVGVIPLLLKCAQIAFSIQKLYQEVRYGFRTKADRICKEINILVGKMLEIRDAVPQGTALMQDVMKLKFHLGAIQQELQDLLPRTWIKRLYYSDTISARLDEILSLVASCETSFQTSCACYLVNASESIKREVGTIEQLLVKTERNTGEILAFTTELQRRMKSRRSQRLRSETAVPVKVRSLECMDAVKLSYAVKPGHTVGYILSRMRKENYDVEDIHFFSWSQGRHSFTDSGQIWRYRWKNERIEDIEAECGQNEGVEVDWRLEYVCSSQVFTLFLVHGLQREAGMTIPHPVFTISPDQFLRVYPFYSKLRILKCRQIQDGKELDLKNNQALENLKPYMCSVCIEVTEDI